MSIKVSLFSGKTVEFADEFGPAQSIRAAEFSEAPASPSLADTMFVEIASVFVAVEKVDGKGMDEIAGKATKNRDILLAFRKYFDTNEWAALNKAFDELYPDPKAPALKEGEAAYTIST